MTDSERLAKERGELSRYNEIVYSRVCYLTNGKDMFFAVHYQHESYKVISYKEVSIHDDR